MDRFNLKKQKVRTSIRSGCRSKLNMNGDYMDNVRCETRRTSRIKKGAYLEDKITSLEQTVRLKILETCPLP
jgi:hypothetical protein